MIEKLVNGTFAAVIADNTILVPEAKREASCSLHILEDEIEPFDLALGFRRTFEHDALREAIDDELLLMLEDGTLQVRHHTSYNEGI